MSVKRFARQALVPLLLALSMPADAQCGGVAGGKPNEVIPLPVPSTPATARQGP